MKISIVLPNFNDPRIGRALDSIRRQTYKNIEIIVVHGGSLSEELKDIYTHNKVDVLIHESDNGIFDALNKGVKISNGDVVYLMGADDYLSDDTSFDDACRLLEKNSKADGVCMGCVFVKGDGSIIREWFPKRITASKIKLGLIPPHFSLFLKKDLYDLVGPFKYKQTNNVATDSIWLIDLAILKPEIQILNMNEHYLNMEYGGASTGSFGAIWRQFQVVQKYAFNKRKDIHFWYTFSLIKTGSKLFQLKF
jgi:glycosyltransferase involved in cell wall biosynthesis